MICFNSKATDKVDFVKPLQNYIKKEFSSDTAKEHEAALQNLQKLREDVRLSFGNEKNDAACERILEYYRLIGAVDKRFPVSENGIRLNFYWYDSVSNRRSAQYSIAFEKANLLFNLGSLQTQIAALYNRSTEDGVKQACKYYQLAAGTYAKVQEMVEANPILAGTGDLHASYLFMMISILLAQAQECIYEKASRGNLSPINLSKLSAQIYIYYEQAMTNLQTSEQKSIDKSWATHLQIRIAYFRSVSYYHVSQSLKSENKYGEELAFLHRAYSYIADPNLQKVVKSSPQYLQEMVQNQIQMVGKTLRSAESDNNMIYHEAVPRELAALTMKSMVKAIPFEETSLSHERDPFKSLVPFAVAQSIAVYEGKKQYLLRDEQNTIKENDELAKTSLHSMDLPGALNLTATNDFPPELMTKIRKFKEAHLSTRLPELLRSRDEVARIDEEILNQADSMLNQEEKEDETVRNNYGAHLFRIPSYTVNSAFRQDIAKYKGNMEYARKSDVLVQKKLESALPLLQQLNASEQAILSMVPQPESASSSNQQCANDLRVMLKSLDELIAERGEIGKKLQQMVATDDISGTLMANPTPHDGIFSLELGKYADLQLQLQKNTEKQGPLLDAIAKANQIYVSSKGGAGKQSARESALQRIDEAMKVAFEVEKNLTEGMQFYSQFQELLMRLKTRVSEFVSARDNERKSIITQVTAGGGQFVPQGMQHASSYGYQQQPPSGGSYNYQQQQYPPPGGY